MMCSTCKHWTPDTTRDGPTGVCVSIRPRKAKDTMAWLDVPYALLHTKTDFACAHWERQ